MLLVNHMNQNKMTHRETLQKAIEIAVRNGWSGCYVTHSTTSSWLVTSIPRLCVSFTTGGNAYYHPSEFVYDHQFAKCLWGESPLHDMIARDYSRDERLYTPWVSDELFLPPNNWKFHLQQMVIADDPLQYLSDNLPESE